MVAAAVLVSAAVIVPCAAWYYAGSRAAHGEANSIRREPHDHGWDVANALAERLGGRLEAIRSVESQRPVYHYHDRFHDPTSTCSCSSWTPSPLATGPSDPLLEAYFQIDPQRNVQLPTLHGEWPQQVTRGWFDEQNSLLSRLESAAAACQEVAGVRPLPTEDGTLDGPDPHTDAEPLQWATVEVGAAPVLMALRRVASVDGDWVQGFLLSTEAVTQSLRPTQYPVRFLTDDGLYDETVVKAPVTLDGAECDWVVELDIASAARQADLRAAGVVGGFHRVFFAGSGVAILAGLLVVWLLWKTDRMGRQRSAFAASAAHELRTPLASLQLYGEMLADNLGDPTRSQQYARRISQEAERLGRVVSNVLGFSHLERGGVQCRPEAGDLAEALRDCLARVQPALEAAGATVRLEVEPEMPEAWFDREALFHIVQNLLDNAEKFSRDARDRTIEVRLSRHGECVVLSVADHGPGIPESFRPHLFEPFARVERKDAPAGLGLGLALVRALVRAQQGAVSFANAPSGGAVFTVSFRTE
jgi:signal transduction histidine kinase